MPILLLLETGSEAEVNAVPCICVPLFLYLSLYHSNLDCLLVKLQCQQYKEKFLELQKLSCLLELNPTQS